MSWETSLAWEAEQIARGARLSAETLAAQERELEEELADLRRDLAHRRAAEARLSGFRPVRHGEPQCPKCFMEDGRQAALTAPDGGPARSDAPAGCPECGLQYTPLF
jgi:ribosomal protein L29